MGIPNEAVFFRLWRYLAVCGLQAACNFSAHCWLAAKLRAKAALPV
jgi:hypothetical protein